MFMYVHNSKYLFFINIMISQKVVAEGMCMAEDRTNAFCPLSIAFTCAPSSR